MKKVNENNTAAERVLIYSVKMDEWNMPEVEIGSRIQYLANLLGFVGLKDMLANYNEETERTVRLLAGPNSYTVYKMLLARREGLT